MIDDSCLRLWAAVLLQAVEDYLYKPPRSYHPNNPIVKNKLRYRNQARNWFGDKRVEINSFRGICLTLSLDPSYVLEGLRLKK